MDLIGVSLVNLVAIGTAINFQQNNRSYRLTYSCDFLAHCNSPVDPIPGDGILPDVQRNQVGVSCPDRLATAGVKQTMLHRTGGCQQWTAVRTRK